MLSVYSVSGRYFFLSFVSVKVMLRHDNINYNHANKVKQGSRATGRPSCARPGFLLEKICLLRWSDGTKRKSQSK